MRKHLEPILIKNVPITLAVYVGCYLLGTGIGKAIRYFINR